MTLSLPEIMQGQAAALSKPMPPEASGDYLTGRLGILAILSVLAAQEAENGFAACVWENGAIRSLLERTPHAVDVAPAAGLAWSALDRENADLRRALIGVHIRAEETGDADLVQEILQLYKEMATRRRLELPASV